MKKYILAGSALFILQTAISQVNEGKIIFERTIQLQIQIANDNPAFQNMIPRERKDRFELLFANNQSLWRPVEDENPADEMSFGDGGGARIVMRMPGSDDVVYHHLAGLKKVEQRELGGKTYIIADSVRRLNWKLTGEKKTILGYNCMQATTQRIQESFRMTMDNGEAKREKVMDTLNIMAWFSADIPGSYGPENYQGQLPGTILELDVNNGRNTFRAIEVLTQTDIAAIKEPAKGKKLTPDEFAKEREKLFKQMQENGGGNMRFNIRN